MAKKDNEKADGDGVVVETTDSPLLDLTDAAVKRMIKHSKKRGFVVSLYVGLYVCRRHQPHGVAKCLQLARPMM